MTTFNPLLWLSRRRQWHPTPVLLPEKSHGQRSLAGCILKSHQELDATKQESMLPLWSHLLHGLKFHLNADSQICISSPDISPLSGWLSPAHPRLGSWHYTPLIHHLPYHRPKILVSSLTPHSLSSLKTKQNKIQLYWHLIHILQNLHFKAYNSMVFSIFTELCNHRHFEKFSFLHKETPCPLIATPYSQLTPPPDKH